MLNVPVPYILRICRLAFHALIGLFIAAICFPFYSQQRRDRAIVCWARKLLSILNVSVEVSEEASVSVMAGCIIAANHVSWLDVFLIHSILPARFVAKSEIRQWPITGWLCAKAGTLFIERDRPRHTAAINRAMRDVVKGGGIVGLFPEGTTTRGDQVKKLHSSLFQSAVESDVPLIPVAIRYIDRQGERSEIPAYVDDISLAQSIRQIIAAPEIRATLHFAPTINTLGKTRRELALETHAAITNILFSTDTVCYTVRARE